MRIRPFKEQDAQAVSDIMIKNLPFNTDGEETKEALRKDSLPERIIEKSKERKYYVTTDENQEIIGIGGHQENELKTFFVNPNTHGKGVGKALIEHNLKQIQAQGYKEATVQSSAHAEKFYEKFGFKRVWKKKVPYRGAQLTIVWMKKEF